MPSRRRIAQYPDFVRELNFGPGARLASAPATCIAADTKWCSLRWVAPKWNDTHDSDLVAHLRVHRGEVEAALTDWCASHGDAPLCRKMQAQ